MQFKKFKDEIQKEGKIEYVIGNSIGEYSGLAISGYTSFEDNFNLICERAHLMESFFEKHECDNFIRRDDILQMSPPKITRTVEC